VCQIRADLSYNGNDPDWFGPVFLTFPTAAVSVGREGHEPKDELHHQSTGSECKHLQTGCKNYLLDSFGHDARIDPTLSKNKNYLGLIHFYRSATFGFRR
jgi:hypothetical protein